jgi:hypothetical protein
MAGILWQTPKNKYIGGCVIECPPSAVYVSLPDDFMRLVEVQKLSGSVDNSSYWFYSVSTSAAMPVHLLISSAPSRAEYHVIIYLHTITFRDRPLTKAY